MGKKMETSEDAIAEMLRLKKKLPPRPSQGEVDIAWQTVTRVDGSLATRLEELVQESRPSEVQQAVFRAYLEMREELMRAQAQADKHMAVATLEIEERHQKFKGLIEKARAAASPSSNSRPVVNGSAYDYNLPAVSEDGIVPDLGPVANNEISASYDGVGSLSWKASSSASASYGAASSSGGLPLSGEEGIEDVLKSVKGESQGRSKGTPDVIYTLKSAADRNLVELKLSNRALTDLTGIGQCITLTKLDISGNDLKELPDSIGSLIRLTHLDAQANQLKVLTFTIGNCTNLQVLDIQKNEIEELPVEICLCTKLIELRVGYNKLKALPEGIGRLTSLEILTVHLNNIKSLPTTISSLTNLAELDAHDNHLESIPEGLCSLPHLRKLDVSANFTQLSELPDKISQLQSLRELNISNNHISVLPSTFGLLTAIEKLVLDQNPWRIPPLDTAKKGKEAVLEYMNDRLQQLERYEKESEKKKGLSSLLGFKKKKSFKYKPKEDLYQNIKA